MTGTLTRFGQGISLILSAIQSIFGDRTQKSLTNFSPDQIASFLQTFSFKYHEGDIFFTNINFQAWFILIYLVLIF